MPGTSVKAINPRLIAAVHHDSPALLAAAAAELAWRAGDMREEDVTAAMEHVRDALETLGELFRKDGAMNDNQYLGGQGDDDAAGKCNDAGWTMRTAAREIGEALAARAR